MKTKNICQMKNNRGYQNAGMAKLMEFRDYRQAWCVHDESRCSEDGQGGVDEVREEEVDGGGDPKRLGDALKGLVNYWWEPEGWPLVLMCTHTHTHKHTDVAHKHFKRKWILLHITSAVLLPSSLSSWHLLQLQSLCLAFSVTPVPLQPFYFPSHTI